jgi:hypothetical protein
LTSMSIFITPVPFEFWNLIHWERLKRSSFFQYFKWELTVRIL